MSLGKKCAVAIILFAFFDLIAMLLYLAIHTPDQVIPDEVLPVLYPVPAFTLTDSLGNDFSRDALNGKIWVADFFFTSCAGPCPVMSTAISKLAKSFADSDNIQFVSVTVDPDTDVPERLHAYGKQYGANFDQWHFLTGPIEKINSLARDGFKLGNGGQPTLHTERFILVDTQGNVRAYFNGTDPTDVAKLKLAINALLENPIS